MLGNRPSAGRRRNLYVASSEFITQVQEFMTEHGWNVMKLAEEMEYTTHKVQSVLDGKKVCSYTFETNFEAMRVCVERVDRNSAAIVEEDDEKKKKNTKTTNAERDKEELNFGDWIPVLCSQSRIDKWVDGKPLDFDKELKSTRHVERVGFVHTKNVNAFPRAASAVYEWGVTTAVEDLIEIVYVGKTKSIQRRVREYVYAANSHMRVPFNEFVRVGTPASPRILWVRYMQVPEADIDGWERAFLRKYKYKWNYTLNKSE